METYNIMRLLAEKLERQEDTPQEFNNVFKNAFLELLSKTNKK
jgi:hypothetical protein